ncbi:MAG: hypothetical protein KKA62_06230 [Nanoarchaeota archaeon]|nr:hypothetical protein [Nanoarchaeota archaeon]MBU1644173.1 hypothetical protein [Nanoarchaeota archaeon]MBU1977522.1 hypothetical protein [Nanoarchaeota archaeon]
MDPLLLKSLKGCLSGSLENRVDESLEYLFGGLTLYQQVQGLFTEVMPDMIYHDSFPFSISDVMQGVLDQELDLKTMKYGSILTGDAIYYHPDGRIKLVHDDKFLRTVDEEYELYEGGFVVQEELFEESEGQTYLNGCVNFFLNRLQSKREADENPALFFLSRNSKLLRKFNEDAFAQTKGKKSMGFLVHSPPKVPIVRPLSIHNNYGDVYLKGDYHADLSANMINVNPSVIEIIAKLTLNSKYDSFCRRRIDFQEYQEGVREYFKKYTQFKRFLR